MVESQGSGELSKEAVSRAQGSSLLQWPHFPPETYWSEQGRLAPALWKAKGQAIRSFCHDEIQFAQGAEGRATRPGGTGELPQWDLSSRVALFPKYWGALTRKRRKEGLPKWDTAIFFSAWIFLEGLNQAEAIFQNYRETWPIFTLPNGGIKCSIWSVSDSHPWNFPMACLIVVPTSHI